MNKLRQLLHKLFQWIKDRFSLIVAVTFRLHIGEDKKQDPDRSPIDGQGGSNHDN